MSLLYRWKACVLLVLLAFYPVRLDAVNFSQCLADVTSCATNPDSQDCDLNITNTAALSVLRTNQGLPIPADSNFTDIATALSYYGCVTYCGKGEGPFSWTIFSQDYTSWFLPYLALLPQLPFGAQRRRDNLMSAILTLGSPTLAGYSLYMTLLNSRWLNDQLFSGIDYPSVAVRQSVVRVLSSLQQVPLRVHPGESARFESLVVHPDNDAWWFTLAEELDYSHTWSISSATSIAWVAIAYLLTVSGSFTTATNSISSNGMGTGSAWLWLLPVVVGWLVLSPKCDHGRVHDAFDKANRHVFVSDSRDPTAPPIPVTADFGLTISSSLHWNLPGKSITSPDESRIPPVFNYARTFSWSRTAYIISLFYRAAWQNANDRVSVNGNYILGNVRSDVPREYRLGYREQIRRYCRPDSQDYPGINVLWPKGMFFNMAVASLMSLQLQWGTTMSAVLAVWYTPTVGLGCRSLAYLLYGTVSTTVWILLVSSSALGYYANHLDNGFPISGSTLSQTRIFSLTSTMGRGRRGQPEGAAVSLGQIRPPIFEIDPDDGATPNTERVEPPRVAATVLSHAEQRRAQTLSRIADWLRWVGKSLATFNAIGIVAVSIFQYAGVYDNCLCNSSVFSWGASAFMVVNPSSSDVHLTTSVWIGALALAWTSSVFFVGTIYIVRDTLPS